MRPPLPSAEGKPRVIAHRGASAYRPENTLAAFELAVEQGADIDGQFTCVQAATCNTFEIMECEHAYGLD